MTPPSLLIQILCTITGGHLIWGCTIFICWQYKFMCLLPKSQNSANPQKHVCDWHPDMSSSSLAYVFLHHWQCRLCCAPAVTFLPLEVGSLVSSNWQASFNHIELSSYYDPAALLPKKICCQYWLQLAIRFQFVCRCDHLYIWKVHIWLKAGSWSLANCSIHCIITFQSFEPL